MRRLLLLLVVVSAAACSESPLRTAANANKQVAVDVVTEFDGVRLYRVRTDTWDTVYVAVSARELRTTWNELEGKGIVQRHAMTVQAP